MEHRPPLGAQRPRSPQRAVSGGIYGLSQQARQRPHFPPRLTNIRSASQPANVIDLTSDGLYGEKSNAAAFLGNRENVVGSPDVINLEDEDGEPPAKRAKTSGEDFGSGGVIESAHRTDKASEVIPGSPLPSLPKAKPSTKRNAGARRHRFGIEPSTRRAHGLDPPAIATRVPPPKKVVDFLPWTGNHIEDQLNENVIKTGFFDKVQGTNQQESNSAKPQVWPSLGQKNHPGLSLLSHVFTAVMDKRQSIGKCTAPSTFKPPPRVTVTDTKREAWLRDLANPDVPLRKQSRTIPHGIRGKLLMDQCLSKAIPLQRAVWLAKCVGANELRSFRRKGVSGSAAASGESKWVREWTMSVQQFVEGVVATCGQQGWQQKIDYAIKLATAFYSERLLDTEHYLDWIVSSLSEVSLERLPLWVMMAQIYWKDITAYGCRGRKLAEGILEHLHCIVKADSETNAPLRTRLQKLVGVLAVSKRECLVIPRVWEKYKHLLAPKTTSINDDTPAENIAKRNDRLVGPLSKTATNSRSPLLDLYMMLDSTSLDLDIGKLASKGLTLVSSLSRLVTGLLDWACTPYRIGSRRIYVAAAMIAHLQNTENDTDSLILQYLGDSNVLPPSCWDNVHRVIIELVRLKAFSVGRYLQWLITSGAMSAGESSTCAVNLIATLPTAGLQLHVLNTRKTLMARHGYAVNERSQIDAVIASIDDAIARSSPEPTESIEHSESLTISARFNLSQQICAKLCDMTKDLGLSLEAFGVARNFIERTGDIASLSALVKAAISSDNSSLLATLTDTVNLHAESFAAIGDFKDIVDGLTEQYLVLRSQQPPDRTFIVALTALAQRVPEKLALVKLLREDLAISEQQISIAVCSPASDSLIGMHATTLESDEDIDAVFASGNTMDDHLMQRVFTRIIQRAIKSQSSGQEPVSRIGGWLNQLRSVDQSGTFDRLVNTYVQNVVKGSDQDTSPPSAIPILVATGCVNLGSVADMTRDIKSPAVAASMLPLFMTTAILGTEPSESEQYRYRLQQDRCQVDHADPLITLLRIACDQTDLSFESTQLVEFVIRCVQDRPGSVQSIFETGKYSEALLSNAGRLIMAIVQRGRVADADPRDLDIRSLVQMTSPLSAIFCIGAVRYFMSMPSFSSEDESALEGAILQSFMDRSEMWPQLLASAREAVNGKMHQWARNQLLSIATSKIGSDAEADADHVKRCLDLLAVTSAAATKTDDTTMITSVTDTLKDLEKKLSNSRSSATKSREESTGLFHQLRIMLHLSVMHVHATPTDSESVRHASHNLLTVFCTLLVHPMLQTHRDLVEYIFDLSSTLVDGLSDSSQVWTKLQNTIKTPSDPRLVSLFGNIGHVTDSWLALASQVHPPGSQQQRTLNKYASQQQQQVGSLSQQSPQQQHQRYPSQGGPGLWKQDSRMPVEMKTTPFPLRRWEIMSDPTPVMGENDTSLSLALFGARKV